MIHDYKIHANQEIIYLKGIDAFKPASVKKYRWQENVMRWIINTVVNGFNYKALPKKQFALTCSCMQANCLKPNCSLLRRSLCAWSPFWRTCSWDLKWLHYYSSKFSQSIMHSHCIINVPEVEQLDGVGVWVTDPCVGRLTVAAILTAQIHKSLLHYCWHWQGKWTKNFWEKHRNTSRQKVQCNIRNRLTYKEGRPTITSPSSTTAAPPFCIGSTVKCWLIECFSRINLKVMDLLIWNAFWIAWSLD